jgi:phage tail-like protein
VSELTFAESFRTHGFAIEINGTRCPVTKVTGLSEGSTDTIEQPEGGSTIVRKIASGVVKFDTLVIERNVDGTEFDQFFKEWFNEMFQLNGTSGASSVRRTVTVLKLENEQVVRQFICYEAYVKSSKFADLEAGTTNLFKQTLEIEHNGLEQVI